MIRTLPIEIPLVWIQGGTAAIGAVSFVFGIFTALFPKRSIAFYEWLMAKLNWRVRPIDLAREVKTTWLLGTALVALSLLLFLLTGCAAIYGYKIHAPGLLSNEFDQKIQSVNERIALYLPPEVLTYQSKDKGGRTADPQTYFIGEAFGPMLVEGFQAGFSEFIFLETAPTPEMMKRYGIPRAAVVRVKEFKNHVTLKGQAVSLLTETAVLDPDLHLLTRFESRGASDAKKVFARRGGPEVNLNAAVENNVLAIVQQLQDWKA